MRHAAWLVALLLAGCTTPEAPDGPGAPQVPDVDGTALQADFDAVAAGGVPDGWSTDGGAWGARAGDGGMVIEGQGDDALNSLLADPAGNFADLDATVRLQVLSDEHPAGAGLVVHYVDADNYQIVRYSLSENGWHLFTMHRGNRDKQGDATVDGAGRGPQLDEWVELRVESRDGTLRAYEDGEMVLEYELPGQVVHVGRVGLFIRGENGALFDDFSVEPLS